MSNIPPETNEYLNMAISTSKIAGTTILSIAPISQGLRL